MFGQWEGFIESNIDISNLGSSNTVPTNADSLNNLIVSNDKHYDITALINGDIDGSYTNSYS